MKTRTSLILCALAVLGLVAVQPVQAATVYWDINDSTAGAGGATPAGTWNAANTYWNDIDGTGTAAVWSAGDTAVFAAGTDATGIYTVTVDGTQDIGGLTFEEGTVTLAVGTAPALQLTSNAEMNVASALTATVATVVSEDAARTLTKTGDGTLVLSGANTYTGLTTVSAGTLTLSGANTGAGGVTLSAGALNINNAAALGTGTLTIGGGTIDNTSGGAITNTNNNAQTWDGDFTFTGTQNLDLGTGAVSLGTAAGDSRTITASANTLTVGGVISDGTTATALTKAGAGTVVLSAANDYTGVTTIGGGVLSLNHADALGGGGNITFTGGALQYTGNNTADYSARIVNSTGAIAIDTNAQDVNFAGALVSSNTGGLTKIGAGTLTLTGVGSSIGGDVRVNAGSMTISGGGTLASGGTANIGYGAADSGNVTVTGSGSTWNNGWSLRVGRDGSNNTLTISDGAQVSSNRTGAGYWQTNFAIGLNADSNDNTVTVTGTGSTLTVGGNGYLEVGRMGSGNALIIENGATATCSLMWTSGGSGNPDGASNSTVTVTGAGSTLSVGLHWDIGDRGTGNQLNILNGGTMNATVGDGYLGYWSSGNTILVDGSGSVMNVNNINTTYAAEGNDNTITVSNSGRINSTGGIKLLATGNAVNLDSGGELNITTLNLSTASSRLNFDAGGRLIAQSSGSLVSGPGLIVLIGAGTISTDYARTIGNVIQGDGTLTKEGTGVLTLSAANTYTGETKVIAGTLALNATGLIASTMLNVEGGTFDASAAASLPTFTSVKGAGTINAGTKTVTLAAGGTLAPGASVGTLTVNDDLTFADGGNTLVAELLGAAADRVTVTGTLTLGDATALEFVFGGANPFQAGTYTLASYATLSGTFSSVTDLGAYSTGVAYGANAITIELLAGLLAADATLDRTVNLDDFARLRNNFGTGDTWVEADFNGTGTVNLDDFAILRNNFGAHVPEPATLALLGLGGLGLILGRKRK